MQIIYPDYQSQMMPIIVGAIGYVPKCLNSHMNDLGFNDKEIKMHVNKMQWLSRAVRLKYAKRF